MNYFSLATCVTIVLDLMAVVLTEPHYCIVQFAGSNLFIGLFSSLCFAIDFGSMVVFLPGAASALFMGKEGKMVNSLL